jgi:uncharacterized membrane protein SpoIIM required for sporulation
MRETKFIDQNKEKWQEFEELLHKRNKDPDKLANLFVEVTDDLAYARSFYPNRSVKAYLNQLAQRIYHSIYKNKRSLFSRTTNFWAEEMPRLIWEARREFLLALAIFVVSLAIGMLSSSEEPEFARYIMGDLYIQMTEANIESGDPMAVYKSRSQFDMFFSITINNLLVALRTFLFGVLSAIGTVAILLYNGIMVGTFQYFFIERGLFWESFSVIWLHGTIEISSIIIAGAAGITMGKGLLFPGTYTRFQAFTIAARRGFKIFLGIVPLIVLAALIESFITRYTHAPDVLKIALIGFSLLFVAGYFVLYPIYKSKVGFQATTPPPSPRSSNPEPILTGMVKNNGTIYAQAFMIYKKYFGRILLLALAVTAFYLLAIHLLLEDAIFSAIIPYNNLFVYFSNLNVFFQYSHTSLLIVLHTITFGAMTGLGSFALKKSVAAGTVTGEFSWKALGHHYLRHGPAFLMIIAFAQLIFFIPNSLSWVLFLLVTPFAYMWLFAAEQRQGTSVFASFGHGFSLASNYFGRLLGLNIVIFLSMFIFFFLVNSPVFWSYFNFLNWMVSISPGWFETLLYNLLVVTIQFSLLLGFPLLTIGMGLQYYNLKEIDGAHQLKSRIKTLKRT